MPGYGALTHLNAMYFLLHTDNNGKPMITGKLTQYMYIPLN